MKNLLLLLSVLLCFSSCRMEYVAMGKEPQKPTQSYVKLNNGTTVNTSKLKIKGMKLKTDNETYNFSDVSEFSDGTTIYATIDGGYVPKIYEGDFNVYQSSVVHTSTEKALSGSGMRTSTISSSSIFIQKEGTSEFHRLNYPSLKKVLPENDPGFAYLKAHRANKAKGFACFAGGLCTLIAAGVVKANSDPRFPGDPPSNQGKLATGLLVVTPVLWMSGAWYILSNQFNLMRAVAKHNGMKVK